MGKQTEDFKAFCLKNNIAATFHEKPKTKGCKEAIAARSVAVSEQLDISQELKTMVLELKYRSGDKRKIAVHMSGDKQLRAYEQMSDYCRDYREISAANLKHLSKDFGVDLKDIYQISFAQSSDLIVGTLNPISLLLYHPEIEQFFDSSLDPDKSYYTNTGERTSGVKIEKLSQLLAVAEISRGKNMISVTKDMEPSAIAAPVSSKPAFVEVNHMEEDSSCSIL